MTGKAGAPLTEAMFYVLMALRRGELCGTEIAAWAERCTEGRVRLGPGTLYTIFEAFSGGGLHSGDVGAGTAAELSVDGEGAAGVPE